MEDFINWEGQILLWLQNHVRADWLTPIMKGITYLGEMGGIWVILSVLFLIIPKTRKLGLVMTCSLALTFVVNNVVIKNVVARIRPYENVENLRRIIAAQSDFSFPSGHTGISFAGAVVLLRETPAKIGIPAIILAFLIAFSRLYVGVHYLTDVLGGAIIGTISALLCCFFYHKITGSKDKIFK